MKKVLKILPMILILFPQLASAEFDGSECGDSSVLGAPYSMAVDKTIMTRAIIVADHICGLSPSSPDPYMSGIFSLIKTFLIETKYLEDISRAAYGARKELICGWNKYDKENTETKDKLIKLKDHFDGYKNIEYLLDIITGGKNLLQNFYALESVDCSKV